MVYLHGLVNEPALHQCKNRGVQFCLGNLKAWLVRVTAKTLR